MQILRHPATLWRLRLFPAHPSQGQNLGDFCLGSVRVAATTFAAQDRETEAGAAQADLFLELTAELGLTGHMQVDCLDRKPGVHQL